MDKRQRTEGGSETIAIVRCPQELGNENPLRVRYNNRPIIGDCSNLRCFAGGVRVKESSSIEGIGVVKKVTIKTWGWVLVHFHLLSIIKKPSPSHSQTCQRNQVEEKILQNLGMDLFPCWGQANKSLKDPGLLDETGRGAHFQQGGVPEGAVGKWAPWCGLVP